MPRRITTGFRPEAVRGLSVKALDLLTEPGAQVLITGTSSNRCMQALRKFPGGKFEQSTVLVVSPGEKQVEMLICVTRIR